MSDQTPSSTLPAQIQFVAYHRPVLADGTYSIEVRPGLRAGGVERVGEGAKTRFFQIAGARFSLQPQEVHSVFPPNGSLGDHENVLPHIVLTRSTLPWERYLDGGSEELPWLALLVFDAGNGAVAPEEKIISIGQLQAQAAATHFPMVNAGGPPKPFPAVNLEADQLLSDQVKVIDVKRELLEGLLPSKEDLQYLAHVRQGLDIQGNLSGGEYAVLIANRLPLSGGISVVHLVSLENRFAGAHFDFQGAAAQDEVRLLSLYSWRFACVNADQSLPGILKHLNTGADSPADHNLRLPAVNQPLADAFLSTGYAPLRHLMRNGDKSVSWYHGPLATGPNPNHADRLPVPASDALLRYDGKTGMFDVSYAAAWELGRLLMLQRKSVSIALYNWKRAHAQQSKIAELQLTHAHLPAQGLFQRTDTTLNIPETVRQWFQDLSLLKGIPFGYLAPDARMLPVESLRFFVIDNEWVECLLDGAFSIGRVVSGDLEQDHGHHHDDALPNPAENPFDFLSGFIMRSEVVAGYPDLQIEAYQKQTAIKISTPTAALLSIADDSDSRLQAALQSDFKSSRLTFVTEILHAQWLVHDLDKDEYYTIRKKEAGFEVWLKNKLMRREKLSENVLLCIYEGQIEEVDMFQKPEILHFGVDRSGGNPETFLKQLKNRQGGALTDKKVVAPKFRGDDPHRRVLEINSLAGDIKNMLSWPTMDSALFAIEMTEGVERIRFKKGT